MFDHLVMFDHVVVFDHFVMFDHFFVFVHFSCLTSSSCTTILEYDQFGLFGLSACLAVSAAATRLLVASQPARQILTTLSGLWPLVRSLAYIRSLIPLSGL